MSVPHPHHVLQQIGLPEKAAAIYVSLLSKRRMTLAEIARESGIKRPTCYEYVDLLLTRGFLQRLPVGKRMFFAAVDPHKILSEFKKKAAILEESVKEMAEIRDRAANKPRVLFYEGKREIRNIYDDLFKTVGDVYSIFPADQFFENFSESDYDEFDKEIAAHALKSKDLIIPGRSYRKIKEIRDKNGGQEVDRRLPDWFQSNVDVLIYGDRVALISLRDLSAVVIENKDIADLFKNIHSGLWKLS